MDEIQKNNIALSEEARSENTPSDRLKELAELNENLAQIVASNVATSSILLEKLASHDSKAVRKAITSNPNTPTEILLKLGKHFSKELLYNPVLELLLLEDLSFLEKIPQQTLYGLLQREDISTSLLDWASKKQNYKITEILQLHIKVSGEPTEQPHKKANKFIQQVNKDSEHSGLLEKYDFFLLSNFLEYTPPVVFTNKWFRIYVAENSNTPNKILEKLAVDEDKLVRKSLANNPNISSKILEQLANDEDSQVRVSVAKNSNLSKRILDQLANDEDILGQVIILLKPSKRLKFY